MWTETGWPGVAFTMQDRGSIITRKVASQNRGERQRHEVRRAWDLEQVGMWCAWSRQS